MRSSLQIYKGFIMRAKKHFRTVFTCSIFYFLPPLILLSGCGLSGIEDGTQRATFIIDGDTIEIAGGERIRYIGIDTPETRQRIAGEWVFAPEPYALEAKAMNEELVRGRALRLELDREARDRYGRILAYVHADGVMVNARLVEQGLATVYTFPPNTAYYEKFAALQEEAIRDKRGVWAELEKIEASNADRHVGRYRKVTGRVYGSRISRGRLYLYLRSGRKGYLRLTIFSRNLPLFAEKGIDPASFYEGKNIIAVGKIEQKHDTVEMMIDNPYQMRIPD